MWLFLLWIQAITKLNKIKLKLSLLTSFKITAKKCSVCGQNQSKAQSQKCSEYQDENLSASYSVLLIFIILSVLINAHSNVYVVCKYTQLNSPGHHNCTLTYIAQPCSVYNVGGTVVQQCGVCTLFPCLPGFLPQSKDMHCRLTGISELSI